MNGSSEVVGVGAVPTQFGAAVRPEYIAMTAVSLASSFILLILYRSLPRVRRTPGWLIARAAACEAVVSACLLAMWVYDAGPGMHIMDQGSPTVLIILALICTAFETAAHAW